MAVTKGLYTEVQYILKNTFLSGDLEADKLIPYIVRAQELYVFDRIGQNLYEHIDGLIANETITDGGNEDYLELARLIAEAVDYWAAAEFLKYGRFTVGNNGIYKKNADNADIASKEDIQMLVGTLESAAENKWSVVYDYLCHNSSNFPEYLSTTGEQRPPSHQIYDMPFM